MHVVTVPRSEKPDRTSLLTLLCGLVLAAHLLLAHASHVLPLAWSAGDPAHSHTAAAAEAQRSAMPPYLNAAALVRACDAAQSSSDCPIPSFLTPRLDPLPSLITLLLWLSSTLLTVGMLVYQVRLTQESIPRPPGPARQALLQRFSL